MSNFLTVSIIERLIVLTGNQKDPQLNEMMAGLKNIFKSAIDNNYYHIIEIVCRHNGIYVSDLMANNKNQNSEWVVPRQEIMYLMKKRAKKTNAKCGAIFEKDHATCTYSKKEVSERIETDKIYRDKLEKIEWECDIFEGIINQPTQ